MAARLKWCAVLVIALIAVACSSDEQTVTPPATSASAATTPPASDYSSTSVIAADLPPLKASLNRGVASPETIRLAYEFAARHPEVLKYVPCFCSCERLGHTGNESCFVGSRDKKGNVTEWEIHGMVCDVCLDVATQAMQMHNSGASVAAIRAAIEDRYASRPNHTPTPMPPVHSSKGK
jgi:hypothetical protein